MFSINELVESKGYKNFMKYVYGWGASVVLIGALFKIMHFPGAALMLTLGLSIEAAIFFFSAFEPLHEELDWTLVYPELAGLTDDFDEDEAVVRRFDRANEVPQVAPGVVQGGSIVTSQQVAGAVEGTPAATGGYVGGGSVAYSGSPSALMKFDEMLEKADIGPEIFEKLGEGLNNLSKTAENLSDIGEAGTASKEFTTKIQAATSSVVQLDETYQKSGEVLKESVNTLSDSYVNSAQTFNETNSGLAESYTNFANKLTEEINNIGSNGTEYSEKLGSLTSNLSALNSVYELQVQNINQHISSSEEYFDGLKGMVQNMNQTVEHASKVNEGVQQLEQNIASLNSIYGNMLSSLNLNK